MAGSGLVQPGNLQASVTADLRGHLAHEGIRQSALARDLDVKPQWLSTRLSSSGQQQVRVTLDDLERITEALGLRVTISIEKVA